MRPEELNQNYHKKRNISQLYLYDKKNNKWDLFT